jgi:NAD(P)H-hydrate epimerase
VQVVVTRPATDFTPVPAHQLDILQRMKVPIAEAETVSQLGSPALIVDGLIGYRLKGAPHGAVSDLIRWANAQPTPILALDVPSGIDPASGTVFDRAIQDTATMTLALPKAGLHAPGVETYVGELYLADISVHPFPYAEPALALEVEPLFAESEILSLCS